MNGKAVTYWTSTILLCGWMGFAAYMYLSHAPKMVEGFASLGYPPYFPTLLGIAKIGGILALLVPGLPRLKEWAYAGFTFTFLAAICSHWISNQHSAVAMPLAGVFLLAISYVTRPIERRALFESDSRVHPPGSALPAH